MEDTREHKVLWRIPKWYRSLYVADDGRHIVTQDEDFIPTNFNNGLVLFTFWREGNKIHEVTLRELVPNRSILQETASLCDWGQIDGFDAEGRLRVRLADGKVFLFDVTTGKAMKTRLPVR